VSNGVLNEQVTITGNNSETGETVDLTNTNEHTDGCSHKPDAFKTVVHRIA